MARSKRYTCWRPPPEPVPGFAVGVQWHPENDWRTDIVSQRIFDDFAAAVHAYAEDGRMGGMSAAAD